jgi:hypothetical protein
VVIDDAVEGAFAAEVVPPGAGLAVNHDNRFTGCPNNFFDGAKVNVEKLDHGTIFGPADDTVANQSRRFS